MEKRNQYWRAFTPDWFKRNQGLLLWLINAPIVRHWFRWILRIHKDFPSSAKVIALRHSSYTFTKDGQKTSDFRTHPKFAKRIYFAFSYVWWLVHAWDWLIADRWIPEWAFGFTTLTAYPDADPETDTVDGDIRNYQVGGVSWSTLRGASSGTTAGDSDYGMCLDIHAHGSNTDEWTEMKRMAFLFDTSSIGTDGIDDATITLRLLGNRSSDFGDFDMVITSSNPASNTALVNGDYDSFGTTNFGSVAFSSTSLYSWIDWTLNASGEAHISKTSISKFGLRSDFDAEDNAPTWVAGYYMRMRFGQADSSTYPPKLVVNHSAAGGALNGTVSITMTPTATIEAEGALIGSVSVVMTPSATIQGDGALIGVTNFTLSLTSTIQGDGALIGQSDWVMTPVANIVADGALIGSSSWVLSASSTIQGAGALIGATEWVMTLEAVPTLGGALNGVISITMTPSAVIEANGALIGSTEWVMTLDAQPTLEGALYGTANISMALTSIIGGDGALIGETLITMTPSATIQAEGTLIGSTDWVMSLTAIPVSVVSDITENVEVTAIMTLVINEDTIMKLGVEKTAIMTLEKIYEPDKLL